MARLTRLKLCSLKDCPNLCSRANFQISTLKITVEIRFYIFKKWRPYWIFQICTFPIIATKIAFASTLKLDLCNLYVAKNI